MSYAILLVNDFIVVLFYYIDLILLKIGLKYTKMMLLICMKMIGDKMMNVLTDELAALIVELNSKKNE
ncbi:hypothetical protein ACVENB_03405 [Staphylococcus aureus]